MVDRPARDKLRVLSFKHRESKVRLLEAIQMQKGHGSLSDTLREAVDEYVNRQLRNRAA